jgi:hypothetical protein
VGKLSENPSWNVPNFLVATWVIEEGSYRRHADEEARISNLASDKVNPNPAELLHAGLSSPILASIGMLSVLPEIAL